MGLGVVMLLGLKEKTPETIEATRAIERRMIDSSGIR